ncbi:MAG: TonB-dependent receptor [Gammaproteobacteria bacterium]|nr:TonB-dependent receptor [Gammaproteobacteria bacterium]
MFCSQLRRVSGGSALFALSSFALTLAAAPAGAQQDEKKIEEITVTGTQIKGAKISDALAVSVVTAEQIELLGVESGEELMDLIPENGQNFLNETDTAGGVNAARGDVGAFNLRNMGTGNTLVLLNGRRMVNAATYQTEEVGGSFVPVNSVNTNHIPVFGVDRIEVLRDGASAIYGADAVAGVLNTVLKDDFEGLTLRVKQTEYDHLPRDDQAIALEWGKALNGGRSHVGLFARYYQRDRVNAQDEARWSNSDFRYRFNPIRIDPSYIYATDTEFRNDSANSLFGQYDVVPSINPRSNRDRYGLIANDVTDTAGEFETYPLGDARCQYTINDQICGAVDGQGTHRYNLNENRDLISKADRTTIYGYFNHEMTEATEFFSEFYMYRSQTNRNLAPSTQLTAVEHHIGQENYYNPLGTCLLQDGSPNPNRLPDSIIGTDVPCEGLTVWLDNYRFIDAPRFIDVERDSYRVLAGLRGEVGAWDWETAAVYSEASGDDIASNRISNTLLREALFDPTPAAYNPFSGGVDSNIERVQIQVFRKTETSLGMLDVKFSNANFIEMPAGPAGVLVGAEVRREDFEDDRDPRLDGTIDFVDYEGDSYPFTSDVVGSSPTPDGRGDRTTTSLFAELQLPLLESLDVQVAARYEDFSDIGDTTVGKIAAGWRPVEKLLVRGSLSTAFRAPNLITINEDFIARSNTLNDWVVFYGVDEGTVASNNDFPGDGRYSIQRRATGSRSLVAEESVNTSIGVVVEPVENLTITLDYWTIEKEDTIGLFGEENHMLLDLVTRLAAGTSDCDNVQGNPAVVRGDIEADDADGFLDAGLCPIGPVEYVSDTYTNLDTRTIKGHDLGIYYDVETGIGQFALQYNGSFYDKYEQEATSGITAALVASLAANPQIVYPINGLGNLLGRDGNQRKRESASMSWRKGDWGASVSGYRIGRFYQALSNGDNFPVPEMTTYSMTFDYSFDIGEINSRVRLGVSNFSDARAPIYDSSFGFSSDAHRDLGRSYYADVRLQF